MIRYLSHWMRSFLFLIMHRLLRDNRGAVIMKDPSFLICGVWIMETGHISFNTGLLGRLHHLITWHGSFDSVPRSVYFGIGRISQWAKLLYLVGPSNPFARRTFGLKFGACALSLRTYCFKPHRLPLQPLPEASLGKG